MPFVERRLKPLPKTFVDEEENREEELDLPGRTRSWTFSDYVPFEMDSADPEAKSESESIPIWPDTDDEEQSSMNFATYRKNTEGSTLEGSPQGSPRSDFSEAAVTSCYSSLDLATVLDMTPPTPNQMPLSNLTLPILPHPVLNHHISSEMLLATNPCVASPCVASPGASTSHAVASPSSTPIGASPFKMDGYDSKTTHSRRSNKDGGSDTGTHKAETRETTTLMIRNLPSHVTQTDLLHELNKLGLSKLYDFCYLPRDFNVVENKGYAFINFVSPETARMFRQSFHRQNFLAGQQPVIADAVVQGLEANLRKWCGPRLSRIRNPDLKPFVAAEVSASDRTPTSATPSKQVKVALQTGDFVLQKARSMMPAVDMQPIGVPPGIP